jgi:hypothetical protein
MDTHIFWSVLIEPGLEHLHVVEDNSGILADGLVLGIADEAPFRLSYQVRANHDWTTRDCRLQVSGPEPRVLALAADGHGHWSDAAGAPLPALDGCLDVDIRVTPFTNTLPIRRLALAPGTSAELQVVYLSVPDLSVRPVRQRYTCLSRSEDGAVYRYEGLETGFRAEVTVDNQGVVVDYANIWKRVWPGSS